MTRPIVKDHNIITGEITEREMNDAEYQQWLLDKAKGDAEEMKHQQKQMLLTKLGITEEEAKLLLS